MNNIIYFISLTSWLVNKLYNIKFYFIYIYFSTFKNQFKNVAKTYNYL